MFYDINELAALLKTDAEKLIDLIDAGSVPLPLYVGGLCRWRKIDIQDWHDQGCPREAVVTPYHTSLAILRATGDELVATIYRMIAELTNEGE
ncbi:MAG: hypothetical protein WCJ35_23960 [Planctomycetota bacterium]